MSSFRKIVVAFLLAASAAIIAGGLLAEETAPPTPPEAPNLTVTKTPLGIFWEGAGWKSFTRSCCSPDLRHVASPLPTENGECITLDGVEGRYYEKVNVPSFSADSKHMAYVAESGGKYLVVKDGIEGKKYDGCERLVFSPDSARVAYTAMSVSSAPDAAAQWCVVTDAVEGKWYPAAGKPVFSSDSKRVAYVTGQTRLASGTSGPGFVVVDGVEMRQCDYSEFLVFSPDSAHWACRITVGNEHLICEDGVDGKAYHRTSAPVFSADSKHMAYIATSEKKQCVVFDGVEGKWYDRIGGNWHGSFPEIAANIALAFSPDSEHLAYAAQEGEEFFIVQDGAEGKRHAEKVSIPFVSPDSGHLAYMVTDIDGVSFVVLDGVAEANKYSSIVLLTFSPDSAHLAYQAHTEEGTCVVLDGVEGRKYGGPEGGMRPAPRTGMIATKALVFTPDSKRTIYIALTIDQKYMIVTNGVDGKEYDRICDLAISPDGSHVAYTASKRQGPSQQIFYVVDGQEVAVEGLKPITGLVFDSPTKCHGIMGDKAAFLIEIEIKP